MRSLLKTYSPQVTYTDITAPHYAATTHLDDSTRMQYIDLFTWLRGDILVKADRMTMAHSLEGRVPFLDIGVFDVARTIPSELKVTAKGVRKYALRQALEQVVPPAIVNRPKLGFPVPTRVWLKGVMYDWARGILADSKADALDGAGLLRLARDLRRGPDRSPPVARGVPAGAEAREGAPLRRTLTLEACGLKVRR
jgi:asparagine synthase (glutamine-hydrolysing)